MHGNLNLWSPGHERSCWRHRLAVLDALRLEQRTFRTRVKECTIMVTRPVQANILQCKYFRSKRLHSPSVCSVLIWSWCETSKHISCYDWSCVSSYKIYSTYCLIYRMASNSADPKYGPVLTWTFTFHPQVILQIGIWVLRVLYSTRGISLRRICGNSEK
jgi:hypothetical protein